MSRPSILSRLQDMTTRVLFGAEKNAAKEYFGHLIDTKIDGSVVTMSSFVDNKDVLCVVNVASQCGLTKKNYTQLTKLVDEYGDRGFKVLAFPCNQFGGQEPGTHEEIMEFANQFGARDKFTFFEKGSVNGAETREVYTFLKNALPWEDGTRDIRWNFAKFLVSHEGIPYKRFGSTEDPFSMKDDIEHLLKKKEEGEEDVSGKSSL